MHFKLKKTPFYLVLIYIVNYYLLGKIIFGAHGIIDIYANKKTLLEDDKRLSHMTYYNNIQEIKLLLLGEEQMNTRYLEELIMLRYNMINKNEKVIILRRG